MSSVKVLVSKNLEIVLGIVAFIIVLLAAWFLSDSDTDVWLVIATASVITSIINIITLQVIRQRQRRVRTETIAEIREMLKDQVTNTLSIISLNTQMSRQMSDKRRKRVIDSVEKIDFMLENLSDETLLSWSKHYANHVNPTHSSGSDSGH